MYRTPLKDVPPDQGWLPLFSAAFKRSKNAMALVDERRRIVDVNGGYLQLLGYQKRELIGRAVYEFVLGGPVLSERQWRAALHQTQFTGTAELRRADGGRTTVEVAGHPAVVTGRPIVLFVALTSSRRGRRLTPVDSPPSNPIPLSARELEVARLIALGDSGPEIAEELQLAHNTVRTHVRNSMAKVGARSRAHLVAKLLGEGIYWAPRT